MTARKRNTFAAHDSREKDTVFKVPILDTHRQSAEVRLSVGVRNGTEYSIVVCLFPSQKSLHTACSEVVNIGSLKWAMCTLVPSV